MSEVERADPTAGGDAPTVGFIEAMKPDRDDNAIAVSEVKSTVATSEDATASAEEIAKETLNAQVEGERSAEATNDETSISSEEKSVNSDAKTTDIIEEIAHTTTENVVDVVQTETERLSTEEADSSPAIVPQSEESSQSKSNTEDKADKSKQNARGNNATCISRLEAEVRKRTKERDSYRKQLEDAETKLAALQASYDAMASPGGDGDLQRSMEQLRGQLVQTALMYEERNRIVANQENQINALNNQVTSLKEVVSITRDLLQIRNMEVKQLQAEVDNMEKKISEERDRHNAMISKMDAAMRLNADLKKEYETQLSLFQSLREKYGEKITLLSAEKQALETAASAAPK